MHARSQRGFTLLELIIVVGIIGALAAIALPQYNSYRTKAELSTVMSNCRSVYRAFAVYYLENGFEYPATAGYTGDVELDFDTTNFTPLIMANMLGGLNFEIDIRTLKKNLAGQEANRVYWTDDGSWQKFYLVMPWGKDPAVQFVVAASDDVKDHNGDPIDSSKYLDGVFLWRDGKLGYQ